MLVLTAQRRGVGIAYVLNQLPELLASGMIDDQTAARVEARMLAELAEHPAARASARPDQASRASRPQKPRRSTDELLAEEAPSLLLYVGAFLIVVSALVFVNVSGEQISDLLKLALMVVGTLGFLGSGIVLHRFPRVLPAGRTFVVIGALLVPVDVLATYALFLRTEPWSAPALWLGGSILGAILYASLAITGFGPTYARFFFAATVSAMGSLLVMIEAPVLWYPAAFVALGLAHAIAALKVTGGPALVLTRPLLLPAQLLMPVALTVAAVLVGFRAVFGTVSGIGDDALERTAVAIAVALGTTNYGLLLTNATARMAALTGLGLLPLSLLFVAEAPADAYAVGLIGLSVLYAFAQRFVARGFIATALPPGTWAQARQLAFVWTGLALLLVPHYAEAPGAGALAYLGAAGLFAALALTSGPRAEEPPHGPRDPLDSLRLKEPLVYVAAGLLVVGGRYALLALPFTREPLRDPLTTGGDLVWAFAGFGASLILALMSVVASRYRPHLRDAFSVSSLATASLVMYLTLSHHAYRTGFAAVYAGLLTAAAVRAAYPRLLWGAGAFAGVGTLALLGWLEATPQAWPISVAAVGIALFILGLVVRRGPYATALREVGAAGAALAAVTGYGLLGDPNSWRFDDALAQATAATLLVLAVLLAAEGRLRGSFQFAAAASASALAAVLMEVALLEPSDPQAYSFLIGTYLVGFAVISLRYGPASWLEQLPAIEGAGALVLLGPTYLATWGPEGVAQGIRLLVEVGGLLAIGLIMQRRWLVAIAVGFVGLEAIRVLVDVVDRLPNWVVFATSGALLLAVGFVLLLKRELWIREQNRIIRWWRGWSPGRAG